MPEQRLVIPFRGAHSASSFRDTPPGFAPLEALRNFDVYDTDEDRPRGGQRPGLKRLFSSAMRDDPVMGFGSVDVAPQEIGVGIGDCVDGGSGTSIESGTLLGNVWRLDSAPSMDWMYYYDPGGTSPGQLDIDAIALSPDGTKLAIAVSWVSGTARNAVRVINVEDQTTVWTGEHTSFYSDPYPVRFLQFTSDSTQLCIGLEDSITLRTVASGIQSDSDTLNTWAGDIKDGVLWNDGTDDYLFVLFKGRNTTGTYNKVGGGTGTITQGEFFRAGVMKFKVKTTGTYEQVQYGTALIATDDWYESNHGYWRLAEKSGQAGRGAEVQRLAIDSAGNVYISRGNAGAGPDNSYPPDLAAIPPLTVFKIAANGNLAWEMDTNSIYEVGWGGYINDVPYGGDTTPDTSVTPIAADASGCYVGGRTNGGGVSLFKLSPGTGTIVWTQDLMDGTGSLRAIEVDPSDGNLVVVGDDNSAWTGASGTTAHMWRVHAGTGAILADYNLSSNVDAMVLAVHSDGSIFYGTEYIP